MSIKYALDDELTPKSSKQAFTISPTIPREDITVIRIFLENIEDGITNLKTNEKINPFIRLYYSIVSIGDRFQNSRF